MYIYIYIYLYLSIYKVLSIYIPDSTVSEMKPILMEAFSNF